eukprot:2486360-Pleurochrysis_carterae.AAC.2
MTAAIAGTTAFARELNKVSVCLRVPPSLLVNPAIGACRAAAALYVRQHLKLFGRGDRVARRAPQARLTLKCMLAQSCER